MNLVICAAEVGPAAMPKCLHPFGGRTVLDELLGVVSQGGAVARVVVASPVRDRQFEPRIREILRRSTAAVGDAVFTAEAHNPADSALVAARHLATVYGAAKEPVLFHTLDAIQYGRDFREIGTTLLSADGYVDVFPSDQPRGSANLPGQMVELSPLQLIAGPAVTGLYGFRSVLAFAEWSSRATSMLDVCRRVLMEGGRLTANAECHRHQTLRLASTPVRAVA